jgi:hypothetical protein
VYDGLGCTQGELASANDLTLREFETVAGTPVSEAEQPGGVGVVRRIVAGVGVRLAALVLKLIARDELSGLRVVVAAD